MQQAPRDGTNFGAYTLIRLIARGGMGEVYEAQENKLQRRVALKLIAPTNPNEHDQDELIRRFMLEARTLAKINHPNVVTIYAIDNIVDVPFIAMEFVDGVAFRELVEQFTFTSDGAAPLFLQMCEGLKCLHDNQIIHRDLKPHNILLRRDGQVKILDFGIAKGQEPNTDHTRAGIVVGTLPYMPPEVKTGTPASPRSDIWSLGAIFFECLTGERLVTAQAEAPKGVDVPFTKEDVGRIPAEMRAIITKMCASRPAQRYQHVVEVLEDLRRFRRDRPQVPAAMWDHLSRKIDEIAAENRKLIEAEAPRVKFNELLAKQAVHEPPAAVSGEIRDITADRQRAAAEANTVEAPVESQSRRWWAVPLVASVLALAFVWKVRERIEPAREVPATPPAATPVAPAPVQAAPVIPVAAVPPPLAVAPGTSALPMPPPVAKEPPPRLIAPADNKVVWIQPKQPVEFTWSRELDVDQYRVEIAGDRAFKDIKISEPAGGAAFRPVRPLEDGTYFWRLKSLQGEEIVGPARVTINVALPAAPVAPTENERLARGRDVAVHFKWTCATHARPYHLEILPSGSPKPVLEQTSTTCEAAARKLAPGSYRWRVRTEFEAGGPPPTWSDPVSFQLEAGVSTPPPAPVAPPRARLTLREPRLATPVVRVTVGTKAGASLSWQKVPLARGYVVQIANAPDFSRVLAEERVNTTQFTWVHVTAGRTYWRVAAFSGETQGPFSEHGQVDALVPAPTLNSSYRVTSPVFDFAPAPLAERYVIQIGRTKNLADAETQTSARPRATLDESGGTFYVRAAAANAEGVAISSFSNLAQVDLARPSRLKPPELLTPPPKARAPARGGRISLIFSWDRAEGADSYVLEISNDADFRHVIERKATRERGAVYKQAALSGRVYWRVRAKAKNEYSEWTRPSFFDVID